VSLVPKWTRVGEYTLFRFLFLNFCSHETFLFSWPVVAVVSLKAPGHASAFRASVLHSSGVYSSALSMEAAGLSETLWHIYHTKLRRISQDLSNLYAALFF
jgi:hypothetical protein